MPKIEPTNCNNPNLSFNPIQTPQNSSSPIVFPHDSNSFVPPPPPLPSYTWEEIRFEDLTKRSDSSSNMLVDLANLPNKQTRIEEIVSALGSLSWISHPFLQANDCYLYLQAAVKEGWISYFQFGTVVNYLSFDSFIKRFRFSTPNLQPDSIPLFQNGKINLMAKQFLQDTLNYKSDPRTLINFDSRIPAMREEDLNRVFEKMSQAPASEQQFTLFIFPETDWPNSFAAQVKWLLTNGFNLFMLQHQLGRFILPSYTLMQTALDVIYRDRQPLQLYPVMGDRRNADLKAKVNFDRQLMSLPSTQADSSEFSLWTDFYQAFMASAAPKNHRLAAARAAEIVGRLAYLPRSCKFSQAILELKSCRYRKDAKWETNNISNSAVFFTQLLISACFRRGLFSEILLDERLFLHVVVDIIRNHDDWQREFGIRFARSIKQEVLSYFRNIIKLSQEECKKIEIVWDMLSFALSLEQAFEAFSSNQQPMQDREFSPNLLDNLPMDSNASLRDQIFNVIQDASAAGRLKEAVEMMFSIEFLAIQGCSHQEFQEYLFAGFTNRNAFKKAVEFIPQTISLFSFSDCQVLDDEIFAQILERKPLSEVYYLNQCSNLTPTSMTALSHILCTELQINGCEQLVQAMHELPQTLLKLQISHLQHLVNNDVATIVDRCPQLTELHMKNNQGITDKGLHVLASLKNLKKLVLNGCGQITLQGIHDLLKNCPQIATLKIKGCTQFVPSDIKELEQRYPHVVIVF